MSKYEHVQIFFTMKKIWPDLSGSYYWRGKLASLGEWDSSGNRGLKEGKETKPQYLVGFKEVLDSAPYAYLNSPTGITSKQKLCSLLFSRLGPSRQLPTESKQTKKPLHRKEKRKSKDRSRHLGECLLHALRNSHVTGVFAFPSNTVWM